MKTSNAFCVSIALHTAVFAGVHGVVSVLRQPESVTTSIPTSTAISVDIVTLSSHVPEVVKPIKKVSPLKKQSNALSDHVQKKDTVHPSSHQLIADPNNKSPLYPDIARDAGVEGAFLVQLTITAAGAVESIIFLEGDNGPDILKQTILKVLKTWKFKNVQIALNHVKIQVPITFSLNDK